MAGAVNGGWGRLQRLTDRDLFFFKKIWIYVFLKNKKFVLNRHVKHAYFGKMEEELGWDKEEKKKD